MSLLCLEKGGIIGIVKYWDLEVWDLGPNGLYLLFSLALNTYLREHTYYDTSNHDL